MPVLIEKNFQELCIKCADIKGDKKLYTTHSYAGNPYEAWFSRVFNLNIAEGEELSEISHIKKRIEDGAYPKTILIENHTLTSELQSVLLSLGFRKNIEQTMMEMDLKNCNFIDDEYTNIKVIDKKSDVKEWFKAVSNVFKVFELELYEKLFDDDDIVFLAMYSGDIIVSTTMLFIQGEVAGLHLVGTNSEYRGCGLGSLITKYALKYALERGCKTAVLQASEMGIPIYEKIGFVERDKIGHWML